ncbi:MAG: alpha-2-macroglobulin family protein [Anaerolineales bacterium]
MAQKDSLLRNILIPAFVAAVLLAVACLCLVLHFATARQDPGHIIPSQIETPVAQIGETPVPGETVSGLGIRLSEGQEQPEPVVPLPVDPGVPLTSEEVANILARLPALPTDPQDQQDFRLPDEVIPPPRTGETIEEPFPPPYDAQLPDPIVEGPLEVLRFSPEGEIPIAPFVNVTFNQPMVPLTSLEDLAEMDVPVQIEPDLPGTWRWLGTKTLNFQYDSDLIDRLPMATEYLVTIPAGTESMTGGVLAKTVEFSFTTPTATLVNHYPYSTEPQPLDPIFFVSFNQRIDPEDVLETIQVEAGGQPVRIEMATEKEIKGDARVSGMTEHAQESRWLAFKATQLLPADTNISVTIGPGTPSAEGPLLTETQQGFSFYTYAPLQIVDHGCSWYEDDCRPLVPLFIEFNNPLDLDVYEDGMLRIEPELLGASVNIYGDTISITGATEGRTTYWVTVDKNIQDVFGQTLGNNERLRFKIGPADPILIGPDNVFVTLDPATADPALSLYAINYDQLDVQIYAVEPSDWPEFMTYLYDFQQTDTPEDPPGRRVLNETMNLELPDDVLSEVQISLTEYMDGDYGHFIVIVRPHRGLFDEDRYWETVQSWVQVTEIGLDAFVDHSEMVVWTNALEDGTPLENITVSAGPDAHITGQDGTVRFDIPDNGVGYLVAQKGGDKALLPRSMNYWYEDSWYSRSITDDLRWYVFDDRGMYRPGEEIHIKGWMRRVEGGQLGDVRMLGEDASEISYQILGPQGNELGTGQADVNALGGFDFIFTLPENANLGYAQLYLTAHGSLQNLSSYQYYHDFQIQEFRRPEFEVTARNETTGPYFVGDHAIVAVEAKYYTGDPLTNAEVAWNVTSSPGSYQPPNWPEFNFGTWTPWWWYYEPDYGEMDYLSYSGVTDASGNHYLRMDFEETPSPKPLSIIAEATVFDVNRQAWAGSTSLLVHPADLYVGMRSDRYFVERGEPLEIEFIVTDLDGKPVADRPIQAHAARIEWKYQDGGWRQVEVDPQDCTVGSKQEPVSCTFETPLGGRYQITAEVTDSSGRKNQSQISRWVSGGQQPPSRNVELEEVTLIPNKETYQPGDVAEILVQPPFTPAEGLLTVSRSGFLYTERFIIDEGTRTLQVPIMDEHIPNLNIQVDLVGAVERTDDTGEAVPGVPPRPAYASGRLNLSIPPLERTLELDVTPRETAIEPGSSTILDLLLTDASGDPVSDAELAVVVVDEAVLAMTNYIMADPISVFYTNRPSDVSSHYTRASIILVDPLALADDLRTSGEMLPQSTITADRAAVMEEGMDFAANAPMEAEMVMGKGGGGPATEPISIRIDFDPLATFAPEVRTAQDGTARVKITVPDNLTRYRIMVVAVDDGGNQFGSGEANLTARLPLMVRPSAPRFLNFGDSFELPVVLQNQTDEPMTVDVALRTTNIKLIGDDGLRVDVPAHDRIEVRFPAETEMAGTARFQVAAVADTYADAATIELPVYTPATTEAFATYGVIDEGAIAQPVAPPSDVFPQFGALEISTSSTALQALTDAVLYLVAYPFECSEQIASRVLGVAALRDVLTAFEADGLPSTEEIEAAVVRDIERLQGMQNWDGGFPYWRRGQDSIPFNTIHVAHALQRADLKGYEVPEDMQARVLEYLRDIESHYPYWYSTRTRQTLSAYALYTRNLMGDQDAQKARNLYHEAGIEQLSLDAIGWIWQTLVDDPSSSTELTEIRRYIGNQVVETPGAANFTTHVHDQTYLLLSSDRRTDAILLDTLILDNPDDELIPKLVNGLLAHREKGRWGNTQENVFVLLAMDRYFNTFESQTPDFLARIWLGDTFAGEHEYEGRTTERHETNIPMSYLVDESLGGGEMQDLIISKEGPGRLYYRLGLSYAPTDLNLDPLDMGFVVQREYEAIDNPDDVTRDEDGTWHIKAGARVRVRLKMVADNRRYHVALVDPLPAGLEIVNPALAVSQSVPQDPDSSDYRYGWWWWWPWYEHQNMRDERAEAFTPLLWDGVYDYTYVARATTPGTFVVPPATAEEMYSPEVFGRSSTDWVVVE